MRAFFISKEASTAEWRYEKEGWKGKLHMYEVQSVTRTSLSILETVSMIADFGQQQWLCTNFRLSDRTLRSWDRILEFSQEIVKICAAAKNLDTHVNFGMSGRYKQPVQYGRDAAHKSRAARAVRSLGVYMSERQHIHKDLNESSSARTGGIRSWRFCRAQIVSGRQTFPPIFLLGAEILTPAKVLSYALYFCQTPTFCMPTNIFRRRLYFVYPPRFYASANISMRRKDFRHPPIFSWDAKILGIRQYFHETPKF